MSYFAHEMELVKEAGRQVESLHEIARVVEAKLAAEPSGAKDFIRPCSTLLQRLLEAQAAVETLLQKLYATGLKEMAGARR
jgi:hypothetical protein